MKQVFFNEIIQQEPIIFCGIFILLIIAIVLAFTLAYIELDKDKQC